MENSTMISAQSTVFYAHPVVLSVPVLVKVISFLFKPSARMQITSPVSTLEPEPLVIEAPSPVCGESDKTNRKQSRCLVETYQSEF